MWYEANKNETTNGFRTTEYRYLDDKGNPIDKNKASKCKVTEYNESGDIIEEVEEKCWPCRKYFSALLYSLLAIMILPILLHMMSLTVPRVLGFLNRHIYNIIMAIYVIGYTYIITIKYLRGDTYLGEEDLKIPLGIYYIISICFLLYTLTSIEAFLKLSFGITLLSLACHILKAGFVKFLRFCRKLS